MNAKQEIRTVECQLSIREAGPDAQGESRTITGTAIVFNAESQLLDDWGKQFREVILPEAATKEFLDTQDIKMNLLHNREMTVARCNKGQGSLRLSVDEHGVNFEFEAPKCDIGDRCLEMVRRGDYSGCSFEFWPGEFDEEHDGKDLRLTHRSFRAIGALTIGMDPAYTQTSVNVREVLDKVEEAAKREEEEEAARKEAEEAAKREAEEKQRQEEEARAEAFRREQRRRLGILTGINERIF